jgi:hypothetical protein
MEPDYRAKASQCRRLARTVNDERDVDQLGAMATEYERLADWDAGQDERRAELLL